MSRRPFVVALLSGIALALVAAFVLNSDLILGVDDPDPWELPGEDEHEILFEGDVARTGDESPGSGHGAERSGTSLTISSDLPLLIWHGSAPVVHNLKTIACGLGSCSVLHRPGVAGKQLLQHPQTSVILYYGSSFKASEVALPRLKHHMWALLHDESPKNNAIFSHATAMELFNITSTFRSESDFPLTLQFLPNLQYLLRPPVPIAEKNKYRHNGEHALAAVVYIQSTCFNPSYRDVYVKELMQFVKIDSLGSCLHNRDLPEAYMNTSTMFDTGFYDAIARYKFVIAFENGLCPDYITEKLWRPLHLGIIPIYRGAPNVREWLPDGKSALIYEEFVSPAKLAETIAYLDSNDTAYNEYLRFKTGEDHITNTRLKERLFHRPYLAENFQENAENFLAAQSDPSAKPDFVSGYECMVCNSVHERRALEERHKEQGLPAPDPRMANASHYGCPAPEEISREQLPDEYMADDDGTFWSYDYARGAREAVALKQMLLAGENDPRQLLSRMYYPAD